ncbi:thiolase family protein [Alicyclobacillus sp. SO9]|uniref:thiolase family protein n=1 Tax=Alicyclobacillus sp. SO9 TaxID=2665646 RepID=UPI0018E81E2C|nr:thiolase family protein [Alicyclobacillus sp. SO9]QQE79774.1 thiolase family protein [Alicyclobacillus sp. SO9]
MEAVIVSAVRTAIGKSGGSLASIPAYKLAASVIREAIARVKLDVNQIDDLIFGNCFSADANLSRLSGLEAGLPVTVPGVTIDRQCASGLNSISLAASLIRAGEGDVYVVGGAENLSQRPYVQLPSGRAYDRRPPQYYAPKLSPEFLGNPPMGVTAENLARMYRISREEQDNYALKSQERMLEAIKAHRFEEQIVGIEVPKIKGESQWFDRDEHPRSTSIQELSTLKPAFESNGTVTAGNSSGINDGAAAIVLMSKKKADDLGLKVLATVGTTVVTGVDPNLMGIGPVSAIRKLLDKSGKRMREIELIELNEAFAAQVLACGKELELDWDRVNVNGGAISHGHPIGATGAILATKLVYEMERVNLKTGLVSMCIGGGQGIATLFERY